MSKYKRIATELKDRELIVEAVGALGGKIEVLTDVRHLPGLFPGQYEYEDAFTASFPVEEARKAHRAKITFAKPAVDNDFEKPGYMVSFDEHVSWVGRDLQADVNAIKQECARRQVYALAEANGFTVQEVPAEGGVVRLQLVRW
jgi:hypothetical protein